MSWLFDLIRAGLEQLANLNILPTAFYFEFVSNAVIAALIIGPLLGVLGTMVVVKRMAFFSQAVGNAALTGVSIGVLLGESYTAPYVSMFGFCLLFGVILKYTQQRTSLSNDVLIGVFLSISLALGSSLLLFVSARMNTHILEAILFGSILTVSHTDLNILVAVAVLCAAVGLPLYNPMLLGSVSPSLAGARGVNVRLNEYVFVILLTLVTAACVKIVGAVLVEALLVIPAAAARNVSRSIGQFVVWSVAIATASGVAGIVLPMQFDLPVPSGGAIILVAALIFGVTAVIRNSFVVFRTQGAV
ncbi:zinc ABC transporter permease [Devosia sp. H5989]|nr:zinc ABC transporter permease [Devosia sp. H5989]